MKIYLEHLSIKHNGNCLIYDRLSTKSQIESFDTHVPILRNYAVVNGYNIVDELYEIGSAYNFHDKLELHTFLENNENVSLIVYDESRLSRNLEASAKIITICKARNIKIHVVGIESPYICDNSSNWRRLMNGMTDAEDESETRSKRSKNYHRNNKILKAANAAIVPSQPLEPVPPFCDENTLELLKKFIFGSDMASFYEAFNKVSTCEEELGSDLYKFKDDDGNEFKKMEAGCVNIKIILWHFNKWNIYQKGKVKWSRKKLEDVILYYLGEEASNLVKIEGYMEYIYDDDIDNDNGNDNGNDDMKE
jgi:predicted site-specific integrase-resolvase